MRRTFLALLVLIVRHGIARGQVETSLIIPRFLEESVVRVWTTSPPMVKQQAILERVRADSLRLLLDGAFVSVPVIEVQRVDRLVPRSRLRGALRGMGFGAMTAVIFDAVIAAIVVKENSENATFTGGVIAVFATPTIVAGGTLIGALNPGVRWATVYRR